MKVGDCDKYLFHRKDYKKLVLHKTHINKEISPLDII